MKEWAESFYKSPAWKKCRDSFMSSKNWICERCGAPAKIAHHIEYLNPHNINNPFVSLNWDNLECLCQECHNIEHSAEVNTVFFDEAGNVQSVRESAHIRQHEKTKEQIDKLLQKLKAPPG